MFIDSVVLTAEAGRGGHGSIAFRREKHVPKGGPSGGSGGKGGDIVVFCDPQAATLLDLRYRKQYKAKRGDHGSGEKKSGRGADDVIIRVPAGTLVYDDETGEQIADFTKAHQSKVVCRGGDGGRGNASFATPTIQAPRRAEDGYPGQSLRLRFELKVMADVGLVGRPNAGKSTLLSVVSAARPKVADYPFTTLKPHLGIVRAGEFESFVLADIPGLIEGAHLGKGLGHQFLRHIQRARVLVYLIDITEDDPKAVYQELRSELKEFDASLAGRPARIALTKADLMPDKSQQEERRALFDDPPHVISSVSGSGIPRWIRDVYEVQKALRLEQEQLDRELAEEDET